MIDHDAPPAFDGRLPPPSFIGIETTRYCNLRCRMCLQFLDGTTVTGPHMSLETFGKIADSVFPFVDRWQPSVSGEPLVSQGLEEMLATAAHWGVKAEMVTNATRLDDAMIERLQDGVAKVVFSFDGATDATFEGIREGARYDVVRRNIGKMIEACRARAAESGFPAPAFGVNATIMKRNVEELADLVELAAKDLGVDYLTATHVFAVSEEMKAQSLVHDIEGARRHLDAAIKRAEELDFKLIIMPLDQVTAATALDDGADRSFAEADGIVVGLERRETWPSVEPQDPPGARAGLAPEDVLERRRRAWETTRFPAANASPDVPDGVEDSIWWCDFLWNRSYVSVEGDVRPCCVYGAPKVGNVQVQPFDEIWNNELYRALRQHLVAKRPVLACRGCMHIREAADPTEIAHLLEGNRPVRVEELPAPDTFDPMVAGRWLGGVEAHGRDAVVELRIPTSPSDGSARITAPLLGIDWTDLRDIRRTEQEFSASFDCDAGTFRVQGRVAGHGEAWNGRLVEQATGLAGNLTLGRVPDDADLLERTVWVGTIRADLEVAPVRIVCGRTALGRPVGSIDLPSENIRECPLERWTFEDGRFEATSQTTLGWIAIAGTMSDEGVLHGTLREDSAELFAVKLEQNRGAIAARSAPEPAPAVPAPADPRVDAAFVHRLHGRWIGWAVSGSTYAIHLVTTLDGCAVLQTRGDDDTDWSRFDLPIEVIDGSRMRVESQLAFEGALADDDMSLVGESTGSGVAAPTVLQRVGATTGLRKWTTWEGRLRGEHTIRIEFIETSAHPVVVVVDMASRGVRQATVTVAPPRFKLSFEHEGRTVRLEGSPDLLDGGLHIRNGDDPVEQPTHFRLIRIRDIG